MKTIKYFLLIFFLLLNPTFSSAVTITPNGKQVTIDSYGSDLSSTAIAAINYIVDNYYDVEVIQSSQANHGRYNCHFFAWHNNQGYGVWDQDYLWRNGLPSELGWDYYPTDYYTDDDYSAPSGYPSYVSTSSTDAEICVYTSGGEINHSARMLQNSSKVISKWGSYGIYKHDPYECPDGRWVWSPWTGGFYHADYGTITDYYKINPNYRPVGTGDPGGRNWGTIENALDGIPSGGVVSVSGIYTQNNSLTIDNSTLYINPGTTIKFGGYYNLVIKDGGKILAEGTSSNSIIFTSATGTERKSWKAIRVYSSHNRFKQCTFKYGDWALHVKGYPNRASGNVIENCTFRDNDQGLRIEKNNATVKNSRVYDNRHGLVCINSTIWFEGNRIYDNDRDGVYSTSSNYLSFKYNVIENNGIGSSSTRNGIYTRNLDIIWLGKMYSSVWSGYNTIRYNYNHEIYASYGNPLVYLNENSVHDNGGYEIYNSTSYCYPAWSCWFGYNGLQSYGCVNESNTLSSPPSWEGSTGTGGALSKSLASGEGGIPGSSGLSDIERIDELKRLISTNPDSPEAVEALFELYFIVRADYTTNFFGEKALFYPFLNRIIYN
ncbi:MAG: right-handed parallel beta-helix repeat-containing protein [Calditrichia bacterium]|nr:right-handed parallel beta-helix repeat-containing protein [Calditrichia bacterium]